MQLMNESKLATSVQDADRTETCSVVNMLENTQAVSRTPRNNVYHVRKNVHLLIKLWQMAWPPLFKTWKASSTGYITIQWISIKKTNCAIHLLNNQGQVNRHLFLVSSCIIVCVRVASLEIFHDESQYGRRGVPVLSALDSVSTVPAGPSLDGATVLCSWTRHLSLSALLHSAV